MNKQPINKLQAGFSMIEVLFALVLLGMVLVGIAVLMTRSLVTAADARYREIANGLAQEVLELYHRERTLSSWDDFVIAGTGKYCVLSAAKDLNDEATFKPIILPNTACASGDGVLINGILFQREVTGRSVGGKLQASVTVAWNSGRSGGTLTQSITAQQEFANWL
ncbi:MAG: hypothetical protein A3A82_01885 [Candidatus Pacebacteria bacterium RIFCSPLOWO2_01_FULL_47_12]|nr:MAG: hypothetical protein A3A82_01885 [Candidatus Pacebacteria bacterium RIFCSPLOWO2_01_FULL_47_12]